MSPEEIVAVVRGIGGLLEPGAGEAWRIALAQVAIVAYQYAIWRTVMFALAGTLFGGMVFVFALGHEADLKHRRTYGYGNGLDGAILAVLVSCLFALGMGIFLQLEYYGRITNPEFYAIQSLIGMIAPQ